MAEKVRRERIYLLYANIITSRLIGYFWLEQFKTRYFKFINIWTR